MMFSISSYMHEHSEPGVTLSQFSFQIPEPLEENYVRKRRTSSATLNDMSGAVVPGLTIDVDLLSLYLVNL